MIARYLAVGLLACMASFSAHAQGSLESLVSEAKAEWMFGQWQAQLENGDPVSLNVSWDLDKHVVILHVKAGDMESKGYTVMEPKAELPNYYSFDNRGSIGKGSWNMESGGLVPSCRERKPGPWPVESGLCFHGKRQHRLAGSNAHRRKLR